MNNNNIDNHMITSHQIGCISFYINYQTLLDAQFITKINLEKRKEDRNLLIPNSPDLKTLLGKITTKGNNAKKGEILKTNGFNEIFKFKAIKFEDDRQIEEQETHRIQVVKQSNFELNEKETTITNKMEEIFSTSSTLNIDEENLEKKFRHVKDNLLVHKLIFDKDVESLKELLSSFESKKELQTELVNHVDFRGNTPLILCVILRSIDKSQEYLDIIQELFNYEVNPKLKNNRKSSALEIATSFEDEEAVKLIFEYLLKRRVLKIERNEIKAGNFLSKIPDIYLEMTWEVNIPLLKFLCPHDTCKLWKVGKNIRLDYSFQQFKNLSSVRRPSSYIFKAGNDQDSTPPSVFQVNHKELTYFNPFEPFDEEEKGLIVKDILNSHRIDGDFKLKKCSVLESKSYFSKKPVIEKINKINAQKYEVNIAASVNLKNKEKFQYENMEKDIYFDKNTEIRHKTVLLMDKNKLKDHLANGFKVKNDKLRDTLMKLDNKEKNLKAYVWVAENFPVKSSHLVAMFNSISGANEFTQKIKEFLNDPEIKKIIDKNGFPIKIVIPINFFIDVTVTFTNFYEIGKESSLNELFEIPVNYTQKARKTVQDLKINPKKRMGYANIQG